MTPPSIYRMLLTALLRGLLLGGAFTLVAGWRGFVLGLVAAPLALIEQWAQPRKRTWKVNLGVVLAVWGLATVLLGVAYLQGPYLRVLLLDGGSYNEAMAEAGAVLGKVLRPSDRSPHTFAALGIATLAVGFSMATGLRLRTKIEWAASLPGAAMVLTLVYPVARSFEGPLDWMARVASSLVFISPISVVWLLVLLPLAWVVGRLVDLLYGVHRWKTDPSVRDFVAHGPDTMEP